MFPQSRHLPRMALTQRNMHRRRQEAWFAVDIYLAFQQKSTERSEQNDTMRPEGVEVESSLRISTAY